MWPFSGMMTKRTFMGCSPEDFAEVLVQGVLHRPRQEGAAEAQVAEGEGTVRVEERPGRFVPGQATADLQVVQAGQGSRPGEGHDALRPEVTVGHGQLPQPAEVRRRRDRLEAGVAESVPAEVEPPEFRQVWAPRQ